MNKTVKYILYAFIGAAILYILYMSFAHFIFSGAFNKKYTRKEVQEHFIRHEKDFLELVSYFDSIVPKGKKQMITFGLGKKGTINLKVLPFDRPWNSGKNFLGGYNLDINSFTLDSALNELGWTKQNAIILRKKLSNTSCLWIKAQPEEYNNPIEIYYKESDLGSFSYYVFEQSLTDSLKEIHGNPVSETSFGKKVAINYSSAL